MTILIAYDGSKPARKAVEYAIEDHAEKEMVLFRVVEVASGATSAGLNLAQEKLRDLRHEATREISDEITDMLEAADIEYDIEVGFGEPAREIIAYTDENDVAQIIIGNHGRKGISRVLLGNEAEKVVRRSPVPVTVVR